MKFCMKCGSQLKDGQVFCTQCGARIENQVNVAEPQPEPQPQSKPQPESQPESMVESQPEPRSQRSANTESEVNPPKKRKGILKKLLAAVIVILAICGAAWYGWEYFSRTMEEQKTAQTVNQIVEDLENGDYDAAKDAYEENYTDGENPEELISSLTESIDKIRTNFEAEVLSYEQAKTELSAISDLSVTELETLLADTENSIDVLNASRTAYATAQSFMDAGNYVKAIKQFDQVAESDANYSEAMNGREEAVNSYRQSTLEQAAAYAEQEDYDAAIAKLNEALAVLENDAALAEQVSAYTAQADEAVRQSYLTKAKNLASGGDYEAAIKKLQAGLEEYTDDAEFVSAISKYEQLYAEEVLALAKECAANHDYDDARTLVKDAQKTLSSNNSDLEDYLEMLDEMEMDYEEENALEYVKQADGYVKDRDYDTAIQIIEEALDLYPGNETLTAKLEELEDSKPTKLSEFKISQLDCFEQCGTEILDGVFPTDTLGNEYEGDNLFRLGQNGYLGTDAKTIAYAEIYLAGEYSEISGAFACLDETSNDVEGTFSIYGDDELLYTYSPVSRKLSVQEFNINVSGVEWLTIKFGDSERTGNAWMSLYMLLIDCVLYKG